MTDEALQGLFGRLFGGESTAFDELWILIEPEVRRRIRIVLRGNGRRDAEEDLIHAICLKLLTLCSEPATDDKSRPTVEKPVQYAGTFLWQQINDSYLELIHGEERLSQVKYLKEKQDDLQEAARENGHENDFVPLPGDYLPDFVPIPPGYEVPELSREDPSFRLVDEWDEILAAATPGRQQSIVARLFHDPTLTIADIAVAEGCSEQTIYTDLAEVDRKHKERMKCESYGHEWWIDYCENAVERRVMKLLDACDRKNITDPFTTVAREVGKHALEIAALYRRISGNRRGTGRVTSTLAARADVATLPVIDIVDKRAEESCYATGA